MALGLEAAGRVHRQLAADLGPAVEDRLGAFAPRREAHRLVLQQLGHGEAVVGLDEVEVVEGKPRPVERLPPCFAAAFHQHHVALAHGQEVVDVARGAEDHRLRHGERRLHIGQHQRRRAVGDRRAVRALERARDLRVLLGRMAAEVVAQVLLKVGEGVLRAVPVVLGGDGGERVGLVAVALEVALRDQAEDAGEAAPDVRFLLHVGGLEQVFGHLLAARAGHLLDADHEHEARAARADRRHALVDRRRARGAGVLHVGGRREAHRVVHLQRQRGGEGLVAEPPGGAHDDLVHVRRPDAGIGERRPRGLQRQRFRVGVRALAERGVAPTDDADTHATLSRTRNSPGAHIGRKRAGGHPARSGRLSTGYGTEAVGRCPDATDGRAPGRALPQQTIYSERAAR